MLSVFRGNLTYVFPKRIHVDESIPDQYVQNQIVRDQGTHHITMIYKSELPNCTRSQMKALCVKFKKNNKWNEMFILGTGKIEKDDNLVYFYNVIWPVANQFRRALGLQSKSLHITIGFKGKDLHNVNKGFTTILPNTVQSSIVSFLNILHKHINFDEEMKKEFIDVLYFVENNCQDRIKHSEKVVLYILRSKLFYSIKDYERCLNDCIIADKLSPFDIDNKLRIAHLYILNDNFYHALHLYKSILSDEELLKNIKDQDEYKKKTQSGIQLCYKKMKTNISPRVRQIVDVNDEQVQLSRNFSWVIPDVLAGISIPKKEKEIDAFEFMNIGLVISVLEEEKLNNNWFKNKDIVNLHYKVRNYHPPTFDDLDDIIEAMEYTINKGRAVIVHCGGGKGRAGTVIACFIIKNGLDGKILVNQSPTMTGKEAIELVREMRPGSIETKMQEDFIKEYCNLLWKKMNNISN